MKADQPVLPPYWDQFLVPGTNLLNMLLAETCVGLSFFTKANYTCDSLVVLQGGERGGLLLQRMPVLEWEEGVLDGVLPRSHQCNRQAASTEAEATGWKDWGNSLPVSLPNFLLITKAKVHSGAESWWRPSGEWTVITVQDGLHWCISRGRAAEGRAAPPLQCSWRTVNQDS